jgi:hypothetical protein
VHDEQRQRPPPLGASGRPEGGTHAGAEPPARDREPFERARRRLGVQPRGAAVTGELDHRLLAERPRSPCGILRVEDELPSAVAPLELELVLEPVDGRPREPQAPGGAAADEVAVLREAGERGGQPDGCQEAAGVGIGELDGLLGGDRAYQLTLRLLRANRRRSFLASDSRRASCLIASARSSRWSLR